VQVAHTAAAVPATPSPLSAVLRADACIAGAGLSALLAGYLLIRARRSVVIVEESAIGALQPGIGTARMSSLADLPWRSAHESEGTQGARVAAHSHAAAIDALEAIVRRERIACELERLDAYCEVRGGMRGARLEWEAARDAGVEDCEVVPSLAVPGGTWGPTVRYPGQVRLQPLKLAHGLANAITRAGGRILLGATPAALTPDRSALITSGGQRIEAGIVVTADAPHAGGRLEIVIAPHIAHVVGVHVARGALAQALYRDARAFPIDASLLSHGRGAGEVLLVGGEDPPGEDDDHTAFRYLALERWACERFPGAGPVVHRGTVQAVHERELFAFSGDRAGVRACARGGSALTRAMLDALAIAGFVEGADTPWPELYLRATPAAEPASAD